MLFRLREIEVHCLAVPCASWAERELAFYSAPFVIIFVCVSVWGCVWGCLSASSWIRTVRHRAVGLRDSPASGLGARAGRGCAHLWAWDKRGEQWSGCTAGCVTHQLSSLTGGIHSVCVCARGVVRALGCVRGSHAQVPAAGETQDPRPDTGWTVPKPSYRGIPTAHYACVFPTSRPTSRSVREQDRMRLLVLVRVLQFLR